MGWDEGNGVEISEGEVWVGLLKMDVDSFGVKTRGRVGIEPRSSKKDFLFRGSYVMICLS